MINVLIPDKKTTNYTLYARGENITKPVHSDDDGGFYISFEGVVVLFYTFEDERMRKHRKAYIVSESGRNLPMVDLECVMKPVRIVYQAQGRRIDILKRACHWIGSNKKLYKAGNGFWIRLTSLIEKDFDGKESALTRERFNSLVERHETESKTAKTFPCLASFC